MRHRNLQAAEEPRVPGRAPRAREPLQRAGSPPPPPGLPQSLPFLLHVGGVSPCALEVALCVPGSPKLVCLPNPPSGRLPEPPGAVSAAAGWRAALGHLTPGRDGAGEAARAVVGEADYTGAGWMPGWVKNQNSSGL